MSIRAPIKPPNINKNSQWLGGVGSGSWFSIKEEKGEYQIERFSKEGKLEFKGIFKTNEKFNIKKKYQFTYLSHYKFCTIIQESRRIIFFLEK